VKVAKTVTMDLDDTLKIREKILKCETPTLSAFVRKAIRKELKRWINMLKKLDKKLKAIYIKYKDQKNPPVPVKKIKIFLELENVPLDEDE